MSSPPDSRSGAPTESPRIPAFIRPAARARLAFPLDVGTSSEASGWVDRLSGELDLFKVGLELFVADGASSIAAVHDRGKHCFLDLKLHDIPATVAGAVKSAVRHRVRYLTIHAGGGAAMMRAAVDAAAGSDTTLLAVTVLTSMDDAELAGVGDTRTASELVVRRAELAWAAGIRGLVCSPEEIRAVRAAVGPGMGLVVPGIRPTGSEVGDQKRVGTPESALASGADVLVVGRPIRNAPDPSAAARSIVAAIERHG